MVAGAEVVADHSWGLVETTVLELLHDGRRYVIKAGGEHDRSASREIRAHSEWLSPWASRSRAPELVRADDAARLIVTRYLPGRLVQGSESESDPAIYQQAGNASPRFTASSPLTTSAKIARTPDLLPG